MRLSKKDGTQLAYTAWVGCAVSEGASGPGAVRQAYSLILLVVVCTGLVVVVVILAVLLHRWGWKRRD